MLGLNILLSGVLLFVLVIGGIAIYSMKQEKKTR